MKMTRTFVASALLLGIALGCSETESPSNSLNDLSPYARQFVSLRLSSSSAMRESSDAAVNQSYQSMMHDRQMFAGGRIAGDSTNTGGDGDSDSTIYYDPWVSCAVITTTTHDDGTITTTYDYGDGCEEGWGDYKYLMHGKYSYTYKYSSEIDGSEYVYSYLFSAIYENYGGQYYYADSTAWSMDGRAHYVGHSSYDTATQEFSGTYNSSDTSIYSYAGIINQYKSKGKSNYHTWGGTVEESEYEYGDGTNFYHSKVVKPLVSNYRCNDVGFSSFREKYIWIPVSGHEVINYKQDGEEGSFEIDYGDGECDNILFIIEDGKRVRVDMGDMMPWFCGTEG